MGSLGQSLTFGIPLKLRVLVASCLYYRIHSRAHDMRETVTATSVVGLSIHQRQFLHRRLPSPLAHLVGNIPGRF